MFVALSPPSLRLVSISSTVAQVQQNPADAASAVVVSVQAKENNVAETYAVAVNAAPLMALG